MTEWATMDDAELGDRLVDLGLHLQEAAPSANVVAVTSRLASARPGVSGRRPGRQQRRLSVLVAATLVVLAGVLAIAPARDALAGWLGIGEVQVRRSPTTVPANPSEDPDQQQPAFDQVALQDGVPFGLRLLDPALAGAPVSGAVDERAPTPLVEVRYRDVTLVQIATSDQDPSGVAKTVGPGTEVEAVSVGGRPGLWISGAPHELAYVAPDGSLVLDTVRRAGDVLLWVDGAVTCRIEGAVSLEAALQLAASMR